MKKFIITEDEKKDIREKQHKELKKILVRKLVEKYENPRLLISEQAEWREVATAGCNLFKSSQVKKWKINDVRGLKIDVDQSFLGIYEAKNGKDGKFKVGDVLFFYMTPNKEMKYDVYASPDWDKPKATYEWGCEAVKNMKTQQTKQIEVTTKEQKDWLEYYKNTLGYKEESELKSYETTGTSRKYNLSHVDGSEKYWPPKGISLWKPLQGREMQALMTTQGEKIKKQQRKISVKTCISVIDSYWQSYSTREEQDSPDPTEKSNVQACINNYYGTGDWGGFLSGKDKEYDSKIRVLTRQQISYGKNPPIYTPEEDSPWLLKPRPTTR